MPAIFQLTGKITVVTGAASGIGQSIAHTFAQAGGFVWALDRDEAGAGKTVESIRAAGGQAQALAVDVSDEAAVGAAAASVLARDGRCDVLANIAGIGSVGTVITTGGDDLDKLYRVNVKGIHFMCQKFLPSMIERKWGSVVNMASIAGIVAVRERYAYTMTKFAVVGLTKSMAVDLAHTKVRVNCICPGRVETPWITQRLKEAPDPKKAYEEMCATQLLGRMARPDEIAAAALYFAADESAFATGSALILDGGWTAGK